MIENEELGLKIAENPEEALWATLAKEAQMLIKQSENNLTIQKAILAMATDKLSLCKKEVIA